MMSGDSHTHLWSMTGGLGRLVSPWYLVQDEFLYVMEHELICILDMVLPLDFSKLCERLETSVR